jgi:uncharacterized protein (TIGR03437 family)
MPDFLRSVGIISSTRNSTVCRVPIVVFLFCCHAALGQSSLALSSGSAAAGSPVTLSLNLSSPAGSEPAAAQWTFSYPAAAVAGFTVATGSASASAGKSVTCAGDATAYTCLAVGINSNTIPNGSVATVSVVLAPTASSVAIAVTNALGASLAGGAVAVSATGGVGSLVMVSPAISSLSCNPNSLSSSTSSTCTVTLNGPAGTGGITANLSSDTSSLTLPISVTIPGASASATFTANAGTLTSDRTATVTASITGSSVPTTISLISPLTVSGLQCVATSLAANASTTCTVTLSKVASGGGATVPLADTAPGALTVPPSVLVPAGSNSATFSASTGALTADQSATVTASMNGSSSPVTISLVSTLTVSSLQCVATSLAANASTTCTVTLSKAASGSGATVTLANTAPGTLTVPPSVLVPAGSNSATFSASTAALTADQSATVTASLNGSSSPVAISLVSTLTLSGLQCVTTSLAANASTTCTVTLSKAASGPGATVSLANTAPGVLTVPNSVLVPAGSNTATFSASTAALTADQSVTITASLSGSSKPVTFSLVATLTVSGLQCVTTSLSANASTTCTVTLSKAASGSGATVSLANTAPGVLTVPTSVLVPAGANSATFSTSFSASAAVLAADQSATITASLNGSSSPVTISLVSTLAVSSLQCVTTSLSANASTTCTVTLSKAASGSGATISLANTAPGVLTVPNSVLVPAGSTTATFSASTAALTADQSATVTASLSGSSKPVTFSLVATLTVSSLQCVTTSLSADASTPCMVTLSKAASGPGATVSLANTAPGVLTVPNSVLVPAAATSATFSASTAALTADQPATVTASLNGSSKPVTLSLVSTPTVFGLQCVATSLTANASTSCAVTLSKAASGSGATVTLANTAPGVLTVPASVLVPAGANSAAFSASTGALTSPQTATLTASYKQFSRSFDLSLTTASSAGHLSSLACTPTAIYPLASGTCTISTDLAVGVNTTVTLKSSNVGLLVPTSVTISSGSSHTSFAFTTTTTLAGWTILSGTLGSVTKSVTFTVTRKAPKASQTVSVVCNPRQVIAGQSSVCELGVNAPASSESLDLAISSSSKNVRVPASVRTQPGQRKARFLVTADADAGDETAVVEARVGSEIVQEAITLQGTGLPTLLVPSKQTGKPGDAVTFHVIASGGQDLPIAISASGLPPNATFDGSTGIFTWVSTEQDLGSRDITFTAINSTGAKVTRAVTVTIADGQPVLSMLQNFAGPAAMPACSPNSVATLLGSFLTGSSPTVELSQNAIGIPGTKVKVNGVYTGVLRATPDRVDFLCPNLLAGTPLQIVVETDAGVSSPMDTTMEETAPGLVTIDGSGTGPALALHTGSIELVALPDFRLSGRPALPGDSLTVLATGIGCDNNYTSRQPLLKLGSDQARITGIAPSNQIAGACEIQFVVLSGMFGDAVPFTIEVLRSDGQVARGNATSLSVDLR